MVRIRINTRPGITSKRSLPDKFVFFFSKLVKAKKPIGWAKYMYVCEWDMCWSNFCNFLLVTEKCEKYVKIATFFLQMSAILTLDFQIRKQLRFSEVSYLNYTKRPNNILHVTTTFSLKQGETRTSSGPIPHPLNKRLQLQLHHIQGRPVTKFTFNTLQIRITTW